jgi:hypothetical protein
MLNLVSGHLWKEIRRHAKKSKVKKAAVAYVSSDKEVLFGDGDLLIVDASDGAITSGQTSAQVLESAFQRGAELYSHPALHAKVMVFGRVAVIGSANVSVRSVESLVEVAVITDQPSIVAGAHAFLEQLKEQSKRIDEDLLSHMTALEVQPRRYSHHKRKEINPPACRTWLVAAWPIDLSRYPNEKRYIQKGIERATKRKKLVSSSVDWIRFPGDSRCRREAKRGDSIVEIWYESGPDGEPIVYRHLPILLRQDEPTCTRLYMEEFADSHRTALTWKQFKRLAERVGLSKSMGPYTERLIPEHQSEILFSRWEKH